jgi:protein-S-isoprenylcysteine O-methyltransferase Ste14
MRPFTGLFIALCWTALFVYLICAAFWANRKVEADRRWNWSWLVFVVFVVLFVLLKDESRLPSYIAWIMFPHTRLVCFGADLLALAGLIVALWGRITLGKNWNLYPSFQENHELMQSGPYAYVRHPMYSGLILMFLGTVIWYGTGLGLIFFVACLLGTWFKLRSEEKILTRHFGAAYASYRERVKALIPFVL